MRTRALALGLLSLTLVLSSPGCSGPERPAPSRPRAAAIDAGVSPRPELEPEAEQDARATIPEDTAAPEGGAACGRSAECASGQQCRGAPGCTGGWACGPARECMAETIAYCDCDGETFFAPGGCAGRPYEHVGPCRPMGELVAAGTELGIPDWDEQPTTQDRTCGASGECARGETCFGIAGCATDWRCVRARGCARDRVTFCGCDGETFTASSTCPGRPFVHRGECRDEAIAWARARDAGAGVRGASTAGGSPDAGTAPGRAGTGPDTARAGASPPPGACRTSRDCRRGHVCQGPPGCGMEGAWTCGPPERACVHDTQVFCDCQGNDFRASMFCPGRPFAHRGSCEIDRMLDLSGAAVR